MPHKKALKQKKRLVKIFHAVFVETIVLPLAYIASSVSYGSLLIAQTCQREILEDWGTLTDVFGHVYIVEIKSWFPKISQTLKMNYLKKFEEMESNLKF